MTIMKRELLEKLQQACELMTRDYHMQTGNRHIRFSVLQLLEEKYPEVTLRTDLVRQAAQLYDEYQGNEEYIHIPDIHQMLYNLRCYPVLGAFDMQSGELEGVVTIKYHENTSEKETDPYYPKPDAKFFSITGVIVKQRENMLNKGLGSNLYASSILGLQEYASQHPEENVELNVVIDCTNLPSLYALTNGNEKIAAGGYLRANQKLPAVLDGIYTVRDEERHLIEAPTYVIKIPLMPRKIEEDERECQVFSYNTKRDTPSYQQYEELLDTILEKIKQDETCMVTQMEDEGTGTVSYIHTDNLEIHLEDMKLERNGTQNIGKKRIPRGDVSSFVGPMPDLRKEIEEDER